MSDYRQKLERKIARAETTLWLAGVVREQVRALQGKPVSKRMATLVEKRLEELQPGKWTVYYSDERGMYHVSAWGGKDSPVQFNDRFDSLICYRDSNRAELKNKTIDEAQWVDFNQCYLLHAERLPKMREALDKLPEWEERKRQIEALQKALSAEMIACECGYLFDKD